MPIDLDIFGDTEPDDDSPSSWEGFLPEDATDSDINWLNGMQEEIGKNISDLVHSPDELEARGKLSDLRGMRFGSGYEAFRWMVTVGLFRWTSLVPLSDGSWGIAIHSTNPEDDGGLDNDEGANDDDLIF